MTAMAIDVTRNLSHGSARHDLGRTENAASLPSSYLLSTASGDLHNVSGRSSSVVPSWRDTVGDNDDGDE